MVPTKINGEYEIVLPKHRADRPEWYTEKGWEKKRLASMHDHLGKGDIVFYVGSEEGEMPALCEMWGAKCVLFEPNDRVWPNTKVIYDANGLGAPLAVFSGFAANHTGEKVPLILNGWPESAFGEVIHDHGFKELRDPQGIPQVKIDDLVEQYPELTPTAISLDVEGSEWEVLRGAEQTMRKHHPKIWLSLHPEFLHEQYNEWGAELRRWLMDLGYTEELLDYPLHEVHLYYHGNS